MSEPFYRGLARADEKTIVAPFTCEQVVALDGYQRSGRFHPFTCPNRGDGKHGTNAVDLGALVPTTQAHGWVCPYCDYTQNWAHAFMVADLSLAPIVKRGRFRSDGIPTRVDMIWMSPAERAISVAMHAVERAGASVALTDAITLLAKARDRVADHVEGIT